MVKAPVEVVLQQEDIKARNPDQVIAEKSVLKAARCLFRDVFQNMDFKNINREEYKGINISTLQTLAESHNIDKIDFEVLVMAGLVSKNALVKILGKGTLEKKLEVHAHAFSKSAVEAIEAKKGTAVIL